MKYMKFVYIPVFTLLKKKYKRSENLFRHHDQTSNQEQPRLVHRRRSPGSNQPPWHLRRQLYALTIAHMPLRQPWPAPLIATVPKKPFKSKAVMSDQTDYNKIPQKEKATLLHFDILRKRSRLEGEVIY